jgi:hypothetical protein
MMKTINSVMGIMALTALVGALEL